VLLHHDCINLFELLGGFRNSFEISELRLDYKLLLVKSCELLHDALAILSDVKIIDLTASACYKHRSIEAHCARIPRGFACRRYQILVVICGP